MKPDDQELAELRARVARLEEQMARLVPTVVAPPSRLEESPAAAVPPVLPAAQPPPLKPVFAKKAEPIRPEKKSEIPSAVWIAAAGAVIFLIGVIYFLTVSIQRGWVSPMVRVIGGTMFGAALGIGAWRMLRGPARVLRLTVRGQGFLLVVHSKRRALTPAR